MLDASRTDIDLPPSNEFGAQAGRRPKDARTACHILHGSSQVGLSKRVQKSLFSGTLFTPGVILTGCVKEACVPTELGSTPQWQFVKAKNPKDCGPMADRLGDTAVYEVALCLGFAPTPERFAALLSAGEVQIWQCLRPGSNDVIAWAIDVFRFDDHEMFVWCARGWDNGLISEILPHMAQAIFTQDKEAIRIWMVIPLPMPQGSEEMLMSMGFDPWKDDAARGLKQTYGLDRTTWAIYNEQSPS